MSPSITLLIAFFIISAVVIAVIDAVRSRSFNRLVWQLIAILTAVGVLNIATGFPLSSGRQAFGPGYSVELAIAVMFVGVIFGMIARYLFFRQQQDFSWLDFTRPVVVAPIVLLPLIGTLEGSGLETIQMVSLAILAFQNGFFWQEVLKNASPRA